MNADSTNLAIIAAALLGGPVVAAQAGVDEPPAVRQEAHRFNPSTSLDDDSVRPLNRSRKPVPAIEQDVFEPQPRAPKHARSADDEQVRPGAPLFRPERSLDDFFSVAKPRPQRAAKPVLTPRSRNAAEDPAGRASESGKPAREGKPEQ